MGWKKNRQPKQSVSWPENLNSTIDLILKVAQRQLLARSVNWSNVNQFPAINSLFESQITQWTNRWTINEIDLLSSASSSSSTASSAVRFPIRLSSTETLLSLYRAWIHVWSSIQLTEGRRWLFSNVFLNLRLPSVDNPRSRLLNLHFVELRWPAELNCVPHTSRNFHNPRAIINIQQLNYAALHVAFHHLSCTFFFVSLRDPSANLN